MSDPTCGWRDLHAQGHHRHHRLRDPAGGPNRRGHQRHDDRPPPGSEDRQLRARLHPHLRRRDQARDAR